MRKKLKTIIKSDILQNDIEFKTLNKNKLNAKDMDMFKKHRQDCEHPKYAQFDIYGITSNFFNKFQ